ncbi:MAG: hypothetical protein N3G78_12270 [Desulfobacterota bacterium]|nr:hypothetical protein [Thermodesulfobacteriota bacterium]
MEREVEERLIQLCRSELHLLELIFKGFRTLKMEAIEEAERAIGEIRSELTDLTGFLIQKGSTHTEGGRDWAKPYLSLSSIFERMLYNMEGMVDRLRAMVRQHILFSDRAVKEVNEVFQVAMDLLENLPDLIRTRNKFLAQHIGEQVRSILKIANGFSEAHEERLIQGICMPKSSPIYLGLLESLKGIIFHTLEVSGKLVSLPSDA